MEHEILGFVRDIIKIGMQIDEHSKLYSTNILKSMEHVQLINFLEEKYEIVVPIEKINIENFDTVESIASFINELKCNE